MKQSNKSGAGIIQALSLVLLMIPVLYTVTGTGIISNIGYEDVYWERARYLLGQGGATLYDGSSLCSLGYSLVLVPICAVFKSPYAAYKAAVLLNGVFLCGSYVMSVMAARRLFPKEKASFLSAACFFAAITPALSTAVLLNGVFLCGSYVMSVMAARRLFPKEKASFLSAACFFAAITPALSTVKSFTGPKMIVLFLIWTSVYCMVGLYESYQRRSLFLLAGCMILLPFFQIGFTGPKMIVLFLIWTSVYCMVGLYESYQRRSLFLLAGCMILLPFFQIGLVGFDLAVIVCLGFQVSRKKLDETVWLKLVLAVLIGIAVGNVAERFVLYGFTEAFELEGLPSSSLEVYLDGLRAGWEKGYFSGLFSALIGKIYVLLVNSLLICALAVWYFIKKRSWKLRKKTDCIFYIFLFQLILTALFDNSRSVSVGLTSLSGIEVCAPLLVLAGIIYINHTTEWSKELIGSLLITCVSAIVTAGVYQKNNIAQISNTNNGILLLFQNWGMNATAVVYCAACLVILFAILFLFCVKVNAKEKMDKIFRVVGSGGFFAVCFVMGILVYRHTAVKFSEENLQKTAPAASVLSGINETEEYFYYANGSLEKELAILQSLMPRQKIQIVKNDRQEQNEFFEMANEEDRSPVIISKTGKQLTEGTFADELPEYRMAYTTGHYAVWAKRGSEVETQINQNVCQRMEELLLHSSVEEDAEDTMSDEELESETQTEEAQTSEQVEINQNVCQRMEELLLHSSVEEDAEDTMSDEELESETQTEEAQTSEQVENALIQEESETEIPAKKEPSKTVTFGTKTMLASGTYRMEIYFGNIDNLAGKSGEVKLSHSDGTLVTKKLNESVLNDGNGMVSVEFSNADIMRGFKVQLKGSIAANAEVDHIYYWKTSPAYTNDGNGMVSVEFSNADIMRGFKVQLKGSIAANAEVDHIYYWKTSPAYTVGLNGGNTTADACAAIQELDELCGQKGSVAYITSDAQNAADLSMRCFEERLPDYDVQITTRDKAESTGADYLIGVTSSHSYYHAMEQYSVIQRGKYYTVLTRNDSNVYEKYLENGGKVLSHEKLLTADAFIDEKKSDDKRKKDRDTIELEAGSYVYYLDVVQLTRNVLPHGVIGSVQFFDEEKKELLAELEIEDTDLLYDADGKTYLSLPLVLREKCSSLSCTLKAGTDLKMEYSLRGIELAAEKYQFGQEEQEIGELCEIVNSVPEAQKLFVVQTLDQINEAKSGFAYLKENMPSVQIETITYDEANDTLTDAFLLTRGLSESYLRLIGKYNIVGQVGQYTLLVRSEGTLAQAAERQGYHALNNGKKVTFESLALTSRVSEEDGTVVKLPKAVYNITLKLSADEIESDDTVEVYLMCDKSEKAVEKEIKELIEQGYTKREAKEKVELQAECAQATYEGYRFDEDDNIVITMRTNKERTLQNLAIDAFSWHGCEIEGEILWVEIV